MTKQSETRSFTMHPNLLRDVIERQAGTLDKAILEQVMNLFEAGASRGDITLTPKKVVIKDDGRGFQTREEVLAAFEVFGKSDERKLEEKRFARYQMGRGQAMAYGKTTYRTRTFEMYVDIRDEDLGLGYRLTENLPDVPGCTVTIDLYEPIDASTMRTLPKQIGLQVKYVPLPVYLNSELISNDPKDKSWNLETEDAYYRFSEAANGIQVFNLGVYVMTDRTTSIGGTVVSKKQLEVNFPRNDVIRSCPVFKEILRVFRSKSKVSLVDRKTFRPEHVLELLSGLDDGTFRPMDVLLLRILRTTNGKFLSLHGLARKRYVAFDEKGSLRADRATQQLGAIMLDIEYCREIFGVTEPKSLYDGLTAMARHIHTYSEPSIPPFIAIEELYAGSDDEKETLPDTKLSKNDFIALKVLREFFDRGFRRGYDDISDDYPRREIKAGIAEAARAWTDGSSVITIQQGTLHRLSRSINGWAELCLLIAHEYAHTGKERTHDGDFYERFHELAFAATQRLTGAYALYVRKMREAKLPLNNRDADRFPEESEDSSVENAKGSVDVEVSELNEIERIAATIFDADFAEGEERPSEEMCHKIARLIVAGNADVQPKSN